MKREDLIKNWDVIEAFKNGANIEVRAIGCDKWHYVLIPDFDFKRNEYRVKPTAEYAPFDFWDAEFLIGKAVKSKESDVFAVITWLDTKNVYIGTTIFTYKELYDWCVFLNGTPCGKLKTK